MQTCRFAIAFLSTLLAGCSDANIKPLDLPEFQGIEPIPAAIGVYYSPEFLNYEATYYDGIATVHLGPASRSVFAPLIRSAFADTVLVDSANPPELVAGEIEAVLIPRIVKFSGDVTGRQAGLPMFTISVRYKLDVEHANGSSLTLSAQGDAKRSGLTGNKAIPDAMRSAAAELWVTLQAAPRNTEWFTGL